jgi:hypothetical protein
VLVGKEVREQRFYGYSVGKWVDDSTLVVQTVGMMPEDKVWLDLTGRPISDAARVEERFHRVNHQRPEDVHQTLDRHEQVSDAVGGSSP